MAHALAHSPDPDPCAMGVNLSQSFRAFDPTLIIEGCQFDG
jgi:hypothetical protein